MKPKLFFSVVAIILFSSVDLSAQGWKTTLKDQISDYGHRNWIIITDAAYPKQSAPGIQTVVTKAGQLEVLNEVLNQVDKASYIKPIIMVDAELQFVTKKNAPGVEAYKQELKSVLKGQSIKEMVHEDIIKKLDKASKLYNILVLKTNMEIPYTSVFIELDCGYWDAASEKELRKTFSAKFNNKEIND